jgi:hypothetical protein
VQGNRNPFVDHPEYVEMIWGNALSTTVFNSLSKIMVYPNPSSDGTLTVSSQVDLEEIDLITVNGQVLQRIINPTLQNHSYSLSNLPKGFFFLHVKNQQESITHKVILN